MQFHTLDYDPQKSARYMSDRHVVDACKTYAQMLSSALYNNGLENPLKPIYLNDPIVQWLSQSQDNFYDFLSFYIAVLDEYKFRYGKIHKYYELFNEFQRQADSLPSEEWVSPPLCIPKSFLEENVDREGDVDYVAAYRRYYIERKHETVRWRKVETPLWYKEGFEEYLYRLYNSGKRICYAPAFLTNKEYEDILYKIIMRNLNGQSG